MEVEKEKWKTVGVRKWGYRVGAQELRKCIESKEKGVRMVIGRDFNARTRCSGGVSVEWVGREEVVKERKRKSKNKKMNREKKALVKFLEERGWGILNELVREYKERKYMFTGKRGNTMIDYVMGDAEVRERIRRLKVRKGVESDHHPVIVIMEGEGQERKREGRGERD